MTANVRVCRPCRRDNHTGCDGFLEADRDPDNLDEGVVQTFTTCGCCDRGHDLECSAPEPETPAGRVTRLAEQLGDALGTLLTTSAGPEVVATLRAIAGPVGDRVFELPLYPGDMVAVDVQVGGRLRPRPVAFGSAAHAAEAGLDVDVSPPTLRDLLGPSSDRTLVGHAGEDITGGQPVRADVDPRSGLLVVRPTS